MGLFTINFDGGIMYNIIFTVSLIILLLLFVGLTLLKGKRHVWYYSVSRIASILISGVASFFLSGLLSDVIADAVYGILIDKIPENVSGILNDLASAPNVFSALITALLAPIFFVIFFFILKIILNCIAKNICIAVGKNQAKKNASAEEPEKKELSEAEKEAEATAEKTETVELTETAETTDTPVLTEASAEPDGKKAKKAKKERTKEEKPKKIKRSSYALTPKANAVGMLCGAFCGLLMFFVIMVPFVGVASIADEVMDLVTSIVAQETLLTVNEVTDGAANNPVSKTFGTVGGKAVYNGLTTTNIDGKHKMTLSDEIHLITTAGDAVMATINNDVPRDEAAASVREVEVAFNDSDLLPVVLPELLAAANESWEKGEDFHGIEKITASGRAQPVVDHLVEILVTSDYDSLKSDTETVIEILAILVEHDAINTAINDPSSIPAQEEMTAPVFYELLKNERFSPMVGTLAEFGIQYIGDQFQLHAHRDALYSEFITEATEKTAAVLTLDEGYRPEQMEQTYINLFDDYGLDVSEDSAKQTAALALEEFSDGAVTEESMKAFLAKTELTLNDGNVIKLDTADTLAHNSLIICVDEITFDMSKVPATETESEALAKAVHEIFTMTKVLWSGEFSDPSSIQKLGPLLDALSNTETMGHDNTAHLLTGILQSDLVHDHIGFSLVEATEMANMIFAKCETQGYTPLLKSLSDTVEVIIFTTSDTVTKEEVTAKVETLLNDLTPESAEVLQQLASTEVMVSQGVPEASAEPVSNLVSNMFGNLASSKDSGMSEEEYKKEAEATSSLLNIALSATSSDGSIFKDTGDDSQTGTDTSKVNGMTASEYIDSVMSSTVITQTIVDTAYADDASDSPALDPLNTGKSLSESEQTQVLNSLNEHWANATEEEKASEDYFKTYAAIGAIVNFPIAVGEDGSLIAQATETAQ